MLPVGVIESGENVQPSVTTINRSSCEESLSDLIRYWPNQHVPKMYPCHLHLVRGNADATLQRYEWECQVLDTRLALALH